MSMVVGPIYVTVLESTREVLGSAAEEGKLRLPVPEGAVQPALYMAAGLTASVVSQTVVVPIDNIVQRIMVDQSAKAASPLVIARKIVAERGFLGLYRGYSASLATYAPTSASIWGLYALFRKGFDALSPRKRDDPWPRDWKDAVVVPISGAMAGASAAALTNPIDVLRTNTQLSDASSVSVSRVAADLYAKHGLAGFYRGVKPRMASIGITMTFVMTFYETLKRISVKRSDE